MFLTVVTFCACSYLPGRTPPTSLGDLDSKSPRGGFLNFRKPHIQLLLRVFMQSTLVIFSLDLKQLFIKDRQQQ